MIAMQSRALSWTHHLFRPVITGPTRRRVDRGATNLHWVGGQRFCCPSAFFFLGCVKAGWVMDRPAIVVNGLDELIKLYAAVSQEYGPRVTLKKFCRLTGVPEGAIYRLVDSFGDLREAVGLSRRVKQESWYSEDDLMQAFHNVVQRLGRLPTCSEFGLYSPMSQRVLFQRLGGIHGAIAKYREWLPRQKEPKPADDFESAMNPQQPEQDPQMVIPWMRKEWLGMRVGFEMRSGDFQGRPAEACDVLVVLNHDWPACPVPVIVFSKILRKPVTEF